MEETKIGEVPVDSGMIIVGDPCWILSKEEYENTLGYLPNDPGEVKTKDKHFVSCQSGTGDGSYPVYITWEETPFGRDVRSLEIRFLPKKNNN